MVSNKLFSSLILPILFLGLFTAGKYFAEQYLTYAHSYPPPYAQNGLYNYRDNLAYSRHLYYAYSGYGSAGAETYYLGSPHPTASVCNPTYGCRTSYTSQTQARKAFGYTYCTNLWLLAPPYMGNNPGCASRALY